MQDVGKIIKSNRTDELNKEIFGNCCINRGLTLLHGNLYLCPFSANATNLKAIKVAKDEILDMKTEKEKLKRKFMIYISTLIFLKLVSRAMEEITTSRELKLRLQAKEPLKYQIIE